MHQSMEPSANTFLFSMTWLKERWSSDIKVSIILPTVVQTFQCEQKNQKQGAIFKLHSLWGLNVQLCFFFIETLFAVHAKQVYSNWQQHSEGGRLLSACGQSVAHIHNWERLNTTVFEITQLQLGLWCQYVTCLWYTQTALQQRWKTMRSLKLSLWVWFFIDSLFDSQSFFCGKRHTQVFSSSSVNSVWKQMRRL